MASRILGVLLLAAGIAGAAVVATRHVEPSAGDVAATSDAVAGAVKAARAATAERAEWLAKMRPLLSALSTDSATVRDLRARELAFTPKTGERIEILQRFKKDGRMVSLARIPETAPAVPSAKDGVVVAAAGDGAELIDVVSVAPDDRADELTGVIAVAQAIDLAAARAAAGALGRVALTTPTGAITLGAEAPPADAAVATTPIAGAPGLTLSVEAKKPNLGLAGLILAIGLVLGAVLVLRKSSPSRAGATVKESAAPAGSAPIATGSATAAKGRTIGRFEILRSLGEGGMAEVYLAKSTGEAGFEKRIALKVLNAAQAADPAAVEHFLDEARLAANLTHPNVVQIADLGKADGAYYIAMEFVDGTDLSRLLSDCRARGERMPPNIALNILGQICAGLHAAHTAHTAEGKPLGIVHRDVKSGNVFVAKNGVVKIGDFGIAKAMERVRRTEVGMVKGTAEYMAPEQRVGGDVDARADQYSVGAIAYEIFSGELINLDLARLAHLGVRGWPHLTPLTELRPDLPPELGAAIFQALAYSPADRFATCEMLGDVLTDIATKHGLGIADKGVSKWLSERLPQNKQQGDQEIREKHNTAV